MTILTKSPAFGGAVKQYSWQNYQLVYETLGQGKPILLLPAFSTVSSRQEMKDISQRLSSQWQVTALDWLGFGASARPPLKYQPNIYQDLLNNFVKTIFTEPIIIIAAGHASGYALKLASQKPNLVEKIVLIAPTWRGPLPTMGASPEISAIVRQLVRSPFIGQFLYYLNTQPWFLRWMYQRHVYVNDSLLTPEFIASKHQITQQSGARYAPAAFVTGGLDPVNSREQFLHLFPSLPILSIIAEQAPPKSKAEMEALSGLANVKIARLPGTLGMSEEFPQEITTVIEEFLF